MCLHVCWCMCMCMYLCVVCDGMGFHVYWGGWGVSACVLAFVCVLACVYVYQRLCSLACVLSVLVWASMCNRAGGGVSACVLTCMLMWAFMRGGGRVCLRHGHSLTCRRPPPEHNL